MEFCLITFRSVTPAQRGEGLLKRNGFSCTLRRTPKWMEEQGCGYSLQLRYRDAEGAVNLLKKHWVPFRKVYLQEDGEHIQELPV